MSDLDPDQTVALFDSATVLRSSLEAALRGRPFPQLGNSSRVGRAARTGGRLPWPLLRRIYTRIGAAEGLDPDRLSDVNLASVARWLADQYPQRRYPAVLIGSSNGAISHLAAAVGMPWLPGTVLVPVKRVGNPDRPVDSMRSGEQYAPRLLERNRDIVLHHMHDQVQDQLMVARMTYFRLKWQRLPGAYQRFLERSLAPDAPVIMIDDRSDWPVVRVGARHVFQAGAQGGLEPEAYLDRPHTPEPDDRAAEAEWGADPDFNAAIRGWCAETGHPLFVISYRGPQAPAHAVASVMRQWCRDRGEDDQQLLVPTFVIGDPWLTINTASVPFWSLFSVQPALQALDDHLAHTDPYRVVRLLLFQHGADSAGIARPEDWVRTITAHGATPDFLGMDPAKFPHDIGFLGRYGTALDGLPRARHLWESLPLDRALPALADHGLPIEGLTT